MSAPPPVSETDPIGAHQTRMPSPNLLGKNTLGDSRTPSGQLHGPYISHD